MGQFVCVCCKVFVIGLGFDFAKFSTRSHSVASSTLQLRTLRLRKQRFTEYRII